MAKTKKRNLLLITETAGESRYWRESLPLLLSFPYHFFYASLRERGPVHELVEGLGGQTFALNCKNSLDYPRATLRLRKIIRENKIDLIHGNESIAALLGGTASRLAGRGGRIFHRHHTWITTRQGLLSKVASLVTDVVMPCSYSAALASRVLDHVAIDRIQVAYNGISPMRAVAGREKIKLRATLGISSGTRIVTMIARLRLQKGFETLFAALSDLDPNLKSKIHLVLVGSGPDELAVKSLAKCVSGISVHFVGHQDDVALWFSLADLVVMPSYTEAFGLTAVEAMSCGKPLVASDIEGISEVVQNGISGILVEPKNPSALAVAMTQVLTSQKLAGQLARAAKQRSTQFTVAAMVQGWQNCYDRF